MEHFWKPPSWVEYDNYWNRKQRIVLEGSYLLTRKRNEEMHLEALPADFPFLNFRNGNTGSSKTIATFLKTDL